MTLAFSHSRMPSPTAVKPLLSTHGTMRDQEELTTLLKASQLTITTLLDKLAVDTQFLRLLEESITSPQLVSTSVMTLDIGFNHNQFCLTTRAVLLLELMVRTWLLTIDLPECQLKLLLVQLLRTLEELLPALVVQHLPLPLLRLSETEEQAAELELSSLLELPVPQLTAPSQSQTLPIQPAQHEPSRIYSKSM